VMLGDALAAQTPIIVTCDNSEQAELPHGDMLINLTRHIPANVGRFQRVFEIISTDEIDAAAGRKRYLDYKQKSYPLTHFVAGKT